MTVVDRADAREYEDRTRSLDKHLQASFTVRLRAEARNLAVGQVRGELVRVHVFTGGALTRAPRNHARHEPVPYVELDVYVPEGGSEAARALVIEEQLFDRFEKAVSS